MTYIRKGEHVYVDPSIPGDGGSALDPAIAIPQPTTTTINGAPIIEQSHEYVIRKPKLHASN
jgi:hypothetical protein